MPKTKSWVEKRDEAKEGYPKIVKERDMVVPLPKEVDEIMRSISKGQIITINEIREKLAKKHHTATTCPLTSGIFAWIAAYAAEEEKAAGKADY